MESLTGFTFTILETPGPMLIRSEIDGRTISFGVNRMKHPRFAAADDDARALGDWPDTGEVAFAMKQHDGYSSVYVGSAPLPQTLLRWLAREAGAGLWSSQPDIIWATRDAAAIVASSDGRRTFSLPRPMAPVEGGRAQGKHELERGEVRIFAAEAG